MIISERIFYIMEQKNMTQLELGKLAFGLLANNLRFVVPNRNESNKSRWKTCRFWEQMVRQQQRL